MPELNPYEAPQEKLAVPKPFHGSGKKQESSGLQNALVFQLVALAVTLGNWVMSEMSPWGGQIQRYAWYAIVAGVVTGIISLGMISAAYRQGKTRWLLFEFLLLLVLVVCACARLA